MAHFPLAIASGFANLPNGLAFTAWCLVLSASVVKAFLQFSDAGVFPGVAALGIVQGVLVYLLSFMIAQVIRRGS